MAFMLDERIDAVLPPWGGDILLEALPLPDDGSLAGARAKWALGLSDVSSPTLSLTLLTETDTAQGGASSGSSPLLAPAAHSPALSEWGSYEERRSEPRQ